MKKFLALLMVIFMFIVPLTSCSSNKEVKEATKEETKEEMKTNSDEKLSVVCTIYPEYDWVKQILGSQTENVNLTLLVDSGVDLHSYQPTVDDIVKISTCDMFIYVGGESDAWVDDVLKEATNKDMVVINLLDVLGETVKEEEVKEGMQEEHAKEHEEGPEHDEHVWLSLKNAEVLVNYISSKLSEIDENNSEEYKANTASYVSELKAIDEQYQKTVDTSKFKTLVFCDRFPFRYMIEDYNLDYYAAFVGCSAETEASFETITFLASKVDELGLTSVLTIEGSDHKIAETVIQSTKEKNQKVLTLDSMQSVTSEEIENGTSYLSLMTKNLETLKEALN